MSRHVEMRGIGCLGCRVTGRSLLEEEVAHLLAAVTGLEVRTSVTVDNPGRRDAIDIYFPTENLYVDLDPEFWHAHRGHRDRAKVLRMAAGGHDYIRVRPSSLAQVPGEVVVPHDSADAAGFAAALLPALARRGISQVGRLEDANLVRRALEDAGARWRGLHAAPPEKSAATERPELLGRFVENLSHPGKTLEWAAPASNDLCRWRCEVCAHVWDCKLVSVVGCSSCAKRATSVRKRTAPYERSLAVLHPALAEQFVRCLTYPDLRASNIGPGSGARAVWRCERGHETTARVSSKVAKNACRFCPRRTESWDKAFAALERFVAREGHALVPSAHVEDGIKLGDWVVRARNSRKAGLLVADRAAALERVSGWVWSTSDERFERVLRVLDQFVGREGHARVPGNHVEDGVLLGKWVSQRRQEKVKGTLSPSRTALLEQRSGWVWDASGPRPTTPEGEHAAYAAAALEGDVPARTPV